MKSSKRLYLYDKLSAVQIFKQNTRFLKGSLIKESQYEKPYLIDNNQQMHLKLPEPDWPDFPDWNLPDLGIPQLDIDQSPYGAKPNVPSIPVPKGPSVPIDGFNSDVPQLPSPPPIEFGDVDPVDVPPLGLSNYNLPNPEHSGIPGESPFSVWADPNFPKAKFRGWFEREDDEGTFFYGDGLAWYGISSTDNVWDQYRVPFVFLWDVVTDNPIHITWIKSRTKSGTWVRLFIRPGNTDPIKVCVQCLSSVPIFGVSRPTQPFETLTVKQAQVTQKYFVFEECGDIEGSPAEGTEVYNYANFTARGAIDYSNAVWATCRNAATGTNVKWDAAIDAIEASIAVNYKIIRTFLHFDLSGTSFSSLTAAKLSLYVLSWLGDSSLLLQESTASEPITTADYDQFTGAVLGTATWTATGYMDINFNATGLTYLESVLGSTAKLCVRNDNHDYDNVTPVSTNRISINTDKWGGALFRTPKLTLTGS